MVGTSLVFAALGFFAGRAGQSPTPAAAVAAGPTSSGITDISQMTPRERADRLFERIMTEHERNNTDQATFFRSMALDAYQMLGQLDADALYHVGLIHSVTGTPDLALAYADSLERGAPRHLFGPMLRQGIYMARGDSAGSRRAYRAFLERYDAERAANRPEYDLHDRAILTFRSEAQASESGRAN